MDRNRCKGEYVKKGKEHRNSRGELCLLQGQLSPHHWDHPNPHMAERAGDWDGNWDAIAWKEGRREESKGREAGGEAKTLAQEGNRSTGPETQEMKEQKAEDNRDRLKAQGYDGTLITRVYFYLDSRINTFLCHNISLLASKQL